MSKPAAGYQRLFAELKRRHVFRVMAVYGIVGFLILQIADLAIPALLLPDWTYRLVALLLLLGFPVAVIITWAFEITPDGIRKTAAADPAQIEAIVSQPATRRWSAGLPALFGGMLLLAGGWWMGQRSTSGTAPELRIPEARAAAFDMVAVLPFEDLGGGEDNEVLASGLQLDLQAMLGQFDDMRVIWPGSVREYRASTKTDREIADELGADFILRGSVRRSGERVRVDVQLIDAETSQSLWGDQFDRDVTPDNLFDIQTAIAAAVARQLASEMSPADAATLDEGPPSTSLTALAAYNEARQIYNASSNISALRQAGTHVDRAVELDPSFVEAWSFLARLNSQISRGDTLRRDSAREAVLRVEALAPGSAHAIAARAFYTYFVENEFETALALLERVEPLAPSDVDVASGIALLHRRLGHWDASLEGLQKAIALDPRSPRLLREYGETLALLGRMEAADAVADRALQVGPANPAVRSLKIWTTIRRYGDAGRAARLAAELGVTPAQPQEGNTLTRLALLENDLDKAVRVADAIPRQTDPYDEFLRLLHRALVTVVRGENATAIGDSMAATELPLGEILAPHWFGFSAAFMGDQDRADRLFEESARNFDAVGDRWNAIHTRSDGTRMKALLGDREEAVEDLSRLVELPGTDISLAGLRLDPIWDRLRDDPRFDAIVERRRAFEERATREAEAARPWLP